MAASVLKFLFGPPQAVVFCPGDTVSSASFHFLSLFVEWYWNAAFLALHVVLDGSVSPGRRVLFIWLELSREAVFHYPFVAILLEFWRIFRVSTTRDVTGFKPNLV